MKKYSKIQTLFKRDPATKHKTLLEGEFSLPEFEYLQDSKWIFTEKVDGTNIRVMWDTEAIRFGGRTDNAQIPTFLYDKLNEMFTVDAFKVFEHPICLYGEGYGAKIQKGGGNYIPDGVSFVLFDVLVDEWWLQRKDVEDIAGKLGLEIVPTLGHGDLHDMVDEVSLGFDSKWGEFQAEGIVARPATELKTRRGDRIITKLKRKDFARVDNKLEEG